MSSAAPTGNQRGVALPLALFTLVIAAVMITAVFYVGRLEQRMGNNSLSATQAFEAAETGVTAVMDAWSTSYNTIANGTTIAVPTASVGPNATYNVTIRRLNTQLYIIQAEGRYLTGGQAVTRRQVARIVRLNPFSVDPEGALITRLGLEVTGTSLVDGRDNAPGGWGGVCGASGPDAPAIVDSSATILTTGPCFGQVCLTGSPKILDDPINVNPAAFDQLGGTTYNALALAADKTVGGSIAGAAATFNPGPTCRTTDLLNWGSPSDPTGPCGNYFPVIHATGNLDLATGEGQGVLLVDGDLTMSDVFRFYGVIIVRGSIELDAGEIYGTIFVKNQAAAASIINGTQISFSRCVIQRAANKASLVSSVKERSWIQLY